MTSSFPTISEEKMIEMLQPPEGPLRLIIDTDTHNEIDDQFALAWALLSQDQLKIEGVVAEPYSFQHRRPPMLKTFDLLSSNPHATVPKQLSYYEPWVRKQLREGQNAYEIPFTGPAEGMELSYHEILKVYDLLDEDPQGKVFRGSSNYLNSLDKPIRSEGAEFIIDRALTGGEGPLYIAAIGCVTNIASAILLEPKIIERIVVLWTSGYPSFFNLSNKPSLNLVQDVLSSRLLFDCGVPHVYLPGYHVGAQLRISQPDMEAWVKDKGKIGAYLNYLFNHNPIHIQRGVDDHFGRTWVIWDMINIAWLLNPDWVPSQLVRSPILDDALFWQYDSSRHLIREAHDVNRDAIFRDFLKKLDKAPS